MFTKPTVAYQSHRCLQYVLPCIAPGRSASRSVLACGLLRYHTKSFWCWRCGCPTAQACTAPKTGATRLSLKSLPDCAGMHSAGSCQEAHMHPAAAVPLPAGSCPEHASKHRHCHGEPPLGAEERVRACKACLSLLRCSVFLIHPTLTTLEVAALAVCWHFGLFLESLDPHQHCSPQETLAV